MNLIEKQGVNYFISGCAIGADLDFAEICVSIRDSEHSDILIEGAIPCDNQDLKWSKPDKERYKTIISKLNRVHYVSHMYSKICFQKRNEYMVDRSDTESNIPKAQYDVVAERITNSQPHLFSGCLLV